VESMTDAQLATLSQQGNREAFGVLAERWNRPLYGFVSRVLGDEEAARDTCQEALLKAYQNLDRLREPDRFKSWLHAIALNLCRDRGRSAKNRALREVGLDDSQPLEPVSEDADPLEEAERRNVGEVLGAVLARLPMDQRTAIVLREFQGFSSSEIGTLTGVSAATVRSRIFYGLKALRRMLPEHGVTPAHLNDGGTVS
jgi:RNA polymerase sigma factor (sigma-70 family)